MFDELIDEFILVPRLREYLMKEPINVSKVANIIYYARAPLQRKRDALLKLENMDIPKDRNSVRDFWKNYRKSVEEAFSLMDSKDAVFVVYEYSLYEHDIDSEEWMHGIFSSYNAALRFVSKDYDSKKDEEDLMHWYVINLWMKEDDESYKDVCDYYIIDNKLCYAEFDFGSEFHESCVNGELNIPVHYKPGDILMADNYPFGPNEKFVMLEIGDNQDCCCLQALSRKQDGTWSVGAVKHGMMGDTIYPRISALYTADTYIPNLSDPEDAILAKVSELVAGDEKKGSELWDRFNASDISSDEKMWKIL